MAGRASQMMLRRCCPPGKWSRPIRGRKHPAPAPSLQVWIAILLTVFTIPVITFATEFLSIEVS